MLTHVLNINNISFNGLTNFQGIEKKYVSWRCWTGTPSCSIKSSLRNTKEIVSVSISAALKHIHKRNFTDANLRGCLYFSVRFTWNCIISFLVWLLQPLLVGVERFCCTWPHSLTHTHTPTTFGRTPLDSDQPNAETSTWQHTTLRRDRHPCPRQDSNPQSQQASGRKTKRWTARPPSVLCVRKYRLWNFGEPVLKHTLLG